MRNVYFHQIFFSENGNPVDSSVKKHLDAILELPYSSRIFDIEGYPVVLSIRHVEPMLKINLYTMVRFKNDSHIFRGSLTDESLEEIKGDFAQLTTFLYDERTNVMVEEYNHEGLKHKDILRYLNEFVANQNVRLHSVQMNENYTLETIRGSSRVNSIEVKLKLDSTRLNLLRETKTRFDTISEVFSSDATDTLEADFASIVFRKDRKKSLNVESVLNFLRVLNVDSDTIQAVYVQFKHLGKNVTMDVKSIDKPLKEQVLQDSTLKNPFLVSIREALVMLYVDKHAGRFDEAADTLTKKMKSCTSDIVLKPVYRQRDLESWVAE